MGSETIKIYIPVEKRKEQIVEEFIHICLNCMDSVTVDTVTKYIKNIEGKIIVSDCTRVACYGRTQLYKEMIKQASMKLITELGLNYLYIEVNDVDESLTEQSIETYRRIRQEEVKA